jgi:predicted Zn-dependent protease
MEKPVSQSPSATEALTLEQVRDQLQDLRKQFRQFIWVGSIAVTALSAIGLAKLSDIETEARKRVDSAVTKGTEYFDLMSNAQLRMNASSWASAATYLEQALALRPDDEFVFMSLLASYVGGANTEAGLRLLESADRNGMLVRKFSGVWTQLNAARLYMVAGVNDGKYIKSAEYHFGRAERAAQALSGGEMSSVLYSQGIFQYLTGDDAKARSTFQRMVELDPRTRQWPAGDRAEPWFQRLLKARPTLQADLEDLFEVKSGG